MSREMRWRLARLFWAHFRGSIAPLFSRNCILEVGQLICFIRDLLPPNLLSPRRGVAENQEDMGWVSQEQQGKAGNKKPSSGYRCVADCKNSGVWGNNSGTGTRTRVARVRAEYPNQLDYTGDVIQIQFDRTIVLSVQFVVVSFWFSSSSFLILSEGENSVREIIWGRQVQNLDCSSQARGRGLLPSSLFFLSPKVPVAGAATRAPWAKERRERKGGLLLDTGLCFLSR